jgi:hypothetical protein
VKEFPAENSENVNSREHRLREFLMTASFGSFLASKQLREGQLWYRECESEGKPWLPNFRGCGEFLRNQETVRLQKTLREIGDDLIS